MPAGVRVLARERGEAAFEVLALWLVQVGSRSYGEHSALDQRAVGEHPCRDRLVDLLRPVEEQLASVGHRQVGDDEELRLPTNLVEFATQLFERFPDAVVNSVGDEQRIRAAEEVVEPCA
jgi:hypothetical protein